MVNSWRNACMKSFYRYYYRIRAPRSQTMQTQDDLRLIGLSVSTGGDRRVQSLQWRLTATLGPLHY